MLLWGAQTVASESPGKIVEDFTDQLMSSVRALGTDNTKTAEYYKQIETDMDSTVQFTYIAKGVMGKYAKSASNAQKQAFLTVFKERLATTLAKAIANYGDAKLTTEEVVFDENNPRKAYVSQKITNREGVVRVIYTMGQWKSGWKIANLTLDSANLGQTYNSQFDQAMRKHGGDIDKTIVWWGENGWLKVILPFFQ